MLNVNGAARVDANAIIERQRNIDGYFLDESAAIWCFLLQEQQATWSWDGLMSGDYLEIGVFKGKSASVLAGYAQAFGNSIAVVDPIILPETRATLDAIGARVEYLPIRSESLMTHEYSRLHYRSVAFAHIDGMHRFAAVQSDLRTCEDMLSDFGVIAIDDFHTDLYPQIPAAVYRYLYSGLSDLSIFLVGFNKVYLCRNVAKWFFKKVVHERALTVLKDLGYTVSLVKTDRNDAFDAYSVTPWQGTPLVGNEHGH
jgi:Methyltransferase domain